MNCKKAIVYEEFGNTKPSKIEQTEPTKNEFNKLPLDIWIMWQIFLIIADLIIGIVPFTPLWNNLVHWHIICRLNQTRKQNFEGRFD
jgi:hypothetical protein